MAHTLGTIVPRAASTSNPITIAGLTLSELDTVVVLLIKLGPTDRTGGAPTINGYAFTQASTNQKAVTAPECQVEFWYFLNPCRIFSAGTCNIVIPNTGGFNITCTVVTGRAADGKKSQVDGISGANNTSVNPAPGVITTTKDGDIGLAVVANGATTWAPSAQVGTIIANTDDGSSGGGEQYHLQATKGAIDLGWTFATSEDWGAIAVYFSEVEPNKFENYKSVKSTTGISVTEKIR